MELKKRNSSIELLRIIAEIGIVFLHYNNKSGGGGFKFVDPESLNYYILHLNESIFICAVNLFIIISGYYLFNTNKRSIMKAIYLILEYFVVRFFSYFCLCLLFNGINTFRLASALNSIMPISYFVVLYIIVYFISPYVNLLLKKLNKEQFTRLVIIIFVIFSVYSYFVDVVNSYNKILPGMSSIGHDGSQSGYTIVNFILMYILGCYIANGYLDKIKNVVLISLSVVSIGAIYLFSLTKNYIAWQYNNPFVILIAISIFLIFKKITFNNFVINELAKGTFSCFLFHTMLIGKFNVEFYVNGSAINMILHQVVVAICLYIMSYVVFKIYDLTLGKIIKTIGKKCNFDLYKL